MAGRFKTGPAKRIDARENKITNQLNEEVKKDGTNTTKTSSTTTRAFLPELRNAYAKTGRFWIKR
jgi:hypothetical protein